MKSAGRPRGCSRSKRQTSERTLERTSPRFKEFGGDLSSLEPYVEDTGEQVWGVEYAVRKGIPIPLLAQAVWGFYESRDADRLSAKAVAVLRNRYGGHPVHEKG